MLAEQIGYPLVVRPSYVLGGRAMEIVHEGRDLERYMREAVKVSNESPVLLDRFLDDAIEVDVDAVADGIEVRIGGVMEHIEQAGVHSGDSACSLPPYSLSPAMIDELKRQTTEMARALGVVGLMNVQFAIQEGTVYVPRSTRAPRARCRSSPRPPASRWPRSPPAAWWARPGRAGRPRRGGAAVLLGQGVGVPVRQVPRRRHPARAGDALHRRGDGSRPHLRRGAVQVAAGSRGGACRRRARSS